MPNVYAQFSALKIFENIRKEEVLDEYVDIVRHCQRYSDSENINQFELWHKALMLYEGKKEWYDASQIIEICQCAPCSNATLDRFFNQLKLVKTDQGTVLSLKSLSAILRIKLRQTPLITFHDQYTNKIVTYWYNQKGRMHQQKRKNYKKQNSLKKSGETFTTESFMLDIDDSSTDNDSDDFSADEDNAQFLYYAE